MVPPLPGRVKLLPSDPVTAIAVAFVAATVSVEAVPGVTDAGFAEIVTVGAGCEPPLFETLVPHPAKHSSKVRHDAIAIGWKKRGEFLIFANGPFRVGFHTTREPASTLDAGKLLSS